MLLNKLIFVLLIVFMPINIFGAGTTALEFLKIGVGSKAAAMGGAFGSIADDGSALYWNPAGISLIKQQEISWTHLNYFEDIQYSFLSYLKPFHSGTAGIGIFYLFKGDIQGYDNYGYETKKHSINNSVVSLSYGMELLEDRLGIGLSFKVLNEVLADESSTVFAFDAGGIYRKKINILPDKWYGFISGWSAGVSVLNVGKKVNNYSLPLNIKVASALNFLNDAGILAVDFNYYKEAGVGLNIGMEWTLYDLISLRSGWKINVSENLDSGLNFGFALNSNGLNFDYAFSPYGILGNVHRFSLSHKFGRKYRLNLIEENINRHFTDGKVLYSQGDLAGSKEKFEGVISVNNQHENAVQWLEKVKKEIDKINYPAQIKSYLAEGEKHYSMDDLIAAKQKFINVLKIDEENKEAIIYLMKIDLTSIYLEEVRDTMAEERKKTDNIKEIVYKDAYEAESLPPVIDPIKIEELSADALYLRGIDSVYKDNMQNALNYLKQAVDKKPGYADAYFELGKVYRKIGEYGESISAFRQVIKTDPDYTFVHFNLWWTYYEAGYYRKAIEAIKQSIKKMPDYGQNYEASGMTYEKIGSYENAINAYTKLTGIWPGAAQVHFRLGVLYFKIQKNELAVDEYNILKNLDEDMAEELLEIIRN